MKPKKPIINEFKKAIENKSIRIYEKDKKPAAFLYFVRKAKVMFIYGKYIFLDLVFVEEEYRGKGIGTKLYDDLFKIAEEEGYDRIVLDIFEKNKQSIDFHKKFRFKKVYSIYEKKIIKK